MKCAVFDLHALLCVIYSQAASCVLKAFKPHSVAQKLRRLVKTHFILWIKQSAQIIQFNLSVPSMTSHGVKVGINSKVRSTQ